MKLFQVPEIETLKFELEDVITSSNPEVDEEVGDLGNGQPL